MEDKQRVKLKEDLEVSYYEFSEDIVCVEVLYKGKELGAFCSDVHQFNEWDNGDLLQLAESQIEQYVSKTEPTTSKRRTISASVEIDYYSYSDDIVCVEVFENGQHVSSFCSDVASFEEWIEDEPLLERIICKQMMNRQA